MLNRVAIMMAVAAVAGICAAATPKPTTRPASPQPRGGVQRVDPAATAAVNKAIKALTDEYQKHLQDAVNPARKKSDYFEESADSAVTVEAVLAALEKRLSPDHRVDAYVKWQLLSFVKDSVSMEHAPRLLAVYQRAPELAMRPGTSDQHKRELEQMLPQRDVDEQMLEVVDESNRQWKDRVYQTSKANEPTLKYREELFRKLPEAVVTYRTAFQDAYGRVMQGVSADQFVGQIIESIKTWSGSAKAAEMAEMAEVLEAVREEFRSGNNPAPEYYLQIRVSDKRRMEWEKRRAEMGHGKEIEDLAVSLRKSAESARDVDGVKLKQGK